MHRAQAAALWSDLLVLKITGAAGASGEDSAQSCEKLAYSCEASRTKNRRPEDGAHGGQDHIESVLQSSPTLRFSGRVQGCAVHVAGCLAGKDLCRDSQEPPRRKRPPIGGQRRKLSCKLTIMNKAERAKPKFAKPQKTTKAEVFAITAATGRSTVWPSPCARSPRNGLKSSVVKWPPFGRESSQTGSASRSSWMGRRSCTLMKPRRLCSGMACGFYSNGPLNRPTLIPEKMSGRGPRPS